MLINFYINILIYLFFVILFYFFIINIVHYKKINLKVISYIVRVEISNFCFNSVFFIVLLLGILSFFLNVNVEGFTFFFGLFIYNSTIIYVHNFIFLFTGLFLLILNKYLKSFIMNLFDFFLLLLLILLALLLLVMCNNFFILFLLVELLSFCFYILLVYRLQDLYSIEASIKYFITGSFSSVFFLLGLLLLYSTQGSLNFVALEKLLHYYNLDSLSVNIAFLFIIVSIFFKLGVAPFHSWLPDTYEGGFLGLITFIALLPKYIFILILLKIYFLLNFNYIQYFSLLCWFSSMLCFFFSIFVLIDQVNVRRFIAYTSINHMGFILLGFFSCNVEGLCAVLFYILSYLIMSFLFFIFLLMHPDLRSYISFYNVLPVVNKPLSYIFVFLFLSFAGIPPLLGFWSKYFIFLSLIKANALFSVSICLFSSVFGIYYYGRFLKLMFFDKKFFTTVHKISLDLTKDNNKITNYLTPHTRIEKIVISKYTDSTNAIKEIHHYYLHKSLLMGFRFDNLQLFIIIVFVILLCFFSLYPFYLMTFIEFFILNFI
jgi:NADH-quinone oxidoreductase subunit N